MINSENKKEIKAGVQLKKRAQTKHKKKRLQLLLEAIVFSLLSRCPLYAHDSLKNSNTHTHTRIGTRTHTQAQQRRDMAMAMPIAAEVGDKITRQYTEDQAEMGRQSGGS